jgi:hypothetical protein
MGWVDSANYYYYFVEVYFFIIALYTMFFFEAVLLPVAEVTERPEAESTAPWFRYIEAGVIVVLVPLIELLL